MPARPPWWEDILKPLEARFGPVTGVTGAGAGLGMLGGVHRIETPAKRFILKTLSEPDAQTAAFRPFAREIAAYEWFSETGAPEGRIPKAYAGEARADGGGALLLEDLGERGATMSDPLAGLSLPQVEAALRAIADIHALSATTDEDARRAGAPRPAFLDHRSPELAAMIAGGLAAFPGYIGRFGRCVRSDRLREVAKTVSVAACLASSHQGAKLRALCHGGIWSNNIMFAGGDAGAPLRAFVIDWQFATWGNPLVDVSFLLLSSLDETARREHGAHLLRVYFDALAPATGRGYSFADCRRDYAAAIAYGAIMTLANTEAFDAFPDKTHQPALLRRLLALPATALPGEV